MTNKTDSEIFAALNKTEQRFRTPHADDVPLERAVRRSIRKSGALNNANTHIGKIRIFNNANFVIITTARHERDTRAA